MTEQVLKEFPDLQAFKMLLKNKNLDYNGVIEEIIDCLNRNDWICTIFSNENYYDYDKFNFVKIIRDYTKPVPFIDDIGIGFEFFCSSHSQELCSLILNLIINKCAYYSYREDIREDYYRVYFLSLKNCQSENLIESYNLSSYANKYKLYRYCMIINRLAFNNTWLKSEEMYKSKDIINIITNILNISNSDAVRYLLGVGFNSKQLANKYEPEVQLDNNLELFYDGLDFLNFYSNTNLITLAIINNTIFYNINNITLSSDYIKYTIKNYQAEFFYFVLQGRLNKAFSSEDVYTLSQYFYYSILADIDLIEKIKIENGSVLIFLNELEG